jgi:hypothetical protein
LVSSTILNACVPHAPQPGYVGHPTVSITLDTYSHAIPAMQEEEALIAGLVRRVGQAS